MDCATRQKLFFVKMPPEQGLKEQGRLYDIKWISTNKEDKVRSPFGGVRDRSAKETSREARRVGCVRIHASGRGRESVDLAHVNGAGEPRGRTLGDDVSRRDPGVKLFTARVDAEASPLAPPDRDEECYRVLLLETMYGTQDVAAVWQDNMD